MNNLNIKLPIEIVQSCYEMQISNQHTTISILENYVLQESSDDSKPKQIVQWVQKQLKHFGSIIRQWLTSLKKFFTQTVPSTIAKFVDMVLRFFKIRKSKTKFIEVPQDATPEEKEHIEKTAEEIAQYNTEKMKDDVVKPTSSDENKDRKKSLNDAKKVITNHIDAVKREKQRQMFIDCMDKGYIPILLGEKVQWAVMCKRIAKMVLQNLDCISEICEVRADKMNEMLTDVASVMNDKGAAEYFSKAIPIDPMNITTGDQSRIEQSKELNTFINTKFGQTWGYYVNTLHKAYSKSYLDSVERELVSVEEVEADLRSIQNMDKEGKEIYSNAEKISEQILNLCKALTLSVKTIDKWKAEEFTGYIKTMQSALMDYITAATKSYTGYINYTIKEYSAALDAKWSNKVG